MRRPSNASAISSRSVLRRCPHRSDTGTGVFLAGKSHAFCPRSETAARLAAESAGRRLSADKKGTGVKSESSAAARTRRAPAADAKRKGSNGDEGAAARNVRFGPLTDYIGYA